MWFAGKILQPWTLQSMNYRRVGREKPGHLWFLRSNMINKLMATDLSLAQTEFRQTQIWVYYTVYMNSCAANKPEGLLGKKLVTLLMNGVF
jgi:hypothetical protein